MKYLYLILLFLTLGFQQGFSKDSDHTVQGHVVDNITGADIDSILVILMTNDSTAIDSTRTLPKAAGVFAGMYEFHIHKLGKYIVKAQCEGYDDAYMNCELRSSREWTVSVKLLRMTRTYHDLPEVTIKATKIKMVMQGDTIVYNAYAFNLAEGSMLDALIAKMPGAKLTKEGQIFVNGNLMESLLVNGHEFFSGNPKVALENLPAYTVNKIKVFKKAGAASRMMNRDMGDKSYVMDVRLKKEYAVGYMGDVEAGMGTEHRYQGRAFGMKFSDKERIGGYVNMNNRNDNQRAAYNGEWSPQDVPNGLLATKIVGLGYINFLKGMFNFVSSDNTWTHISADNQQATHAQTFLPGGDSYQNSVSKEQRSSDEWTTKNALAIEEEKHNSLNLLNLSYLRSHGLGNNSTETSNSTSLLNRMLSTNSMESRNFNFDFSTENGIKNIADMLRLNAAVSYNHRTEKTFDLNDVQYQQSTQPRDYRNKYTDQYNQQFKLSSEVSYDFGFRYISLRPEYGYTYSFHKASNLLYRLDQLQGRDSTRYDVLPSTVDALAGVLDGNNTYRFHDYRNQHRFNLYFNDLTSKIWNSDLTISLPVRLVTARLYYDRMGRHDVRRQSWFFEPSFYLRGDVVEIQASMKSELPDLTSMVDYRDDSNPLTIQLGNANLRNIHYYDIDVTKRIASKSQELCHVSMGYHQTDNAVANSLTFDKATGISTIRPVSVNGNWKADLDFGYTQALDSAQKFSVDNQITVNYNHNVDMATVAGYADSQRSIVNNWQAGGNLKLNYRPDDSYEFSLHGGGNYYFISSRREGFTDIHAGDYNIGANAQLSLPWKFQITTDLTMFARRGYQQSEMNTTDWIWNAQLTRSFVKGKLLAKLQGFDILHQLSNTQYAMNAQGRTETWHNSIPRYVMLSLSWRFNVNPKKKSK
jgi:hypothetical protein